MNGPRPVGNGQNIPQASDTESVAESKETGKLKEHTVTIFAGEFQELDEAIHDGNQQFDELTAEFDALLKEVNDLTLGSATEESELAKVSDETVLTDDLLSELEDVISQEDESSSSSITVRKKVNERLNEVSAELERKVNEAADDATYNIKESDLSDKAKESALSRLKTKKIAGLLLVAIGVVITAISIPATFFVSPAAAIGVAVGLGLIYGGMFLTTYGAAEEAEAERAEAMKRRDHAFKEFEKPFPDFLKAYDKMEDMKGFMNEEIKQFISKNKEYYEMSDMGDYELKPDVQDKKDEIEEGWNKLQKKFNTPGKAFPIPDEEGSKTKTDPNTQWREGDSFYKDEPSTPSGPSGPKF